SDEQKFLEASMAYVAGNSIMTDKEYDQLKRQLKVYNDLTVDCLKMFLIGVPTVAVALGFIQSHSVSSSLVCGSALHIIAILYTYQRHCERLFDIEGTISVHVNVLQCSDMVYVI
ncbi:PGR5-like protein 1B, chloroplastic, partial [Tanacetum coccineum]